MIKSGVQKIAFATPVGLEQDAIDMGQIDDFAAGSDGFQEAGDAKIAGATQVALGGADDQIERFRGKGAVGQAAQVKLSEDKVADLVGIESRHGYGISNTGFDFLVDGQIQRGDEGGQSDEDEVVIFRELLKQKAQFPEGIGLHQMRVINEWYDHFAVLIEFVNLDEKPFFALEIAAVGFGLKGVAQQAQKRGIGVESSGHRREHEPLGIVLQKNGFNDRFSCARLAQQEAKATLLAMNQQGIKDFLLMS
jgi:hypothetical protein